MKWLKRLIIGLLALVFVSVVLLWITGNEHVLYGIGKTYLIGKSKPDIDDMEYFPVSTLLPGEPMPWPESYRFNHGKLSAEHERYLDSLETCALLVVHRDSLLFEKYWRGYTDSTKSNSFSMAKSFTGMLVGIAIEDGYIRSLDQPVSDFIPQFAEGKNSELTLRHLITMSSGIPFGESYASPFGYMARAYYGKNLEEETLKYNVEKTPGTVWSYEGGNSVLLGLVLKNATGKTPSQYFAEKIWSCIGTEHEGHWNLDHENGLEKTFSGFYATARDFARIGKLYLHDGAWEGDTLMDPEFVKASVTPCLIPDPEGTPCAWYGYHWWIGEHRGEYFYSCRGMRGQYIAVVPSRELVVVRLGHDKSEVRDGEVSEDLRKCLDAAIALSEL
jgi:CubicO group peptidase (beta-lactamase class C family)